jgi:hypothetical protein
MTGLAFPWSAHADATPLQSEYQNRWKPSVLRSKTSSDPALAIRKYSTDALRVQMLLSVTVSCSSRVYAWQPGARVSTPIADASPSSAAAM